MNSNLQAGKGAAEEGTGGGGRAGVGCCGHPEGRGLRPPPRGSDSTQGKDTFPVLRGTPPPTASAAPMGFSQAVGLARVP